VSEGILSKNSYEEPLNYFFNFEFLNSSIRDCVWTGFSFRHCELQYTGFTPLPYSRIRLQRYEKMLSNGVESPSTCRRIFEGARYSGFTTHQISPHY